MNRRPDRNTTDRAALNLGRSEREVEAALRLYDSVRYAASSSVADFDTIVGEVIQIIPHLGNRIQAAAFLLVASRMNQTGTQPKDKMILRVTRVIHVRDVEGGIDPMSPIGAIKAPPEDYVFIGRPSKWGNPFIIDVHGTRDQVITKYEEYVLKSKLLMSSLGELAGKRLGCFCSPKACHGDVLVKLVKRFVRVE